MSIGVSVRTTKFITRNNGGTSRQERSPRRRGFAIRAHTIDPQKLLL